MTEVFFRENTGKFSDPDTTLDGKPRAMVSLFNLETLWFNTGTLCNLTCANCYIESSPQNDRLSYLTRGDVARYLEELSTLNHDTRTIGITGGEPFMNPDIIAILDDCLEAGFEVLVLTNAMKPMLKLKSELLAIKARFGERLVVRVSVDHYRRELHEEERGRRSWRPMLQGLRWLGAEGFRLHVAGRRRWGDEEKDLRLGFARLFAAHDIGVDAQDSLALVLFPEMDVAADVPEITTECWATLGVDPDQLMCATSRMVVKRKGAAAAVAACTLLPYDPQFEFGNRLVEALEPVSLNHPHCAKFCVLGGGSCVGGSSPAYDPPVD